LNRSDSLEGQTT